MMFRNAVRVTVILASAAVLAQSAKPGTTPAEPSLKRQSLAEPRGPAGNTATDPLGLAAIREQVGDMESTLSGMRVVLKQMHARAPKSETTDSLTRANLNMWDLMVDHLDKELQQLRQTLASREDMEARRVALYKQADAKIDAAAQAARASQAARFVEAQKNATGTATPTTAPTEQSTGQSGQQSTTRPTAPAPPTSRPASPN